MSNCVFTICSRNYLHYAITLMESVRIHQPDLRRIVALCDAPGPVNPPIDPDLFEILPMCELGIPELDAMMNKYTVLELNTAIKPSVFRFLFEKRAFEGVIYLDPDILIYHDFSSLFTRWESNSILLTPHLIDPIQDDRFPGELTFLLCGTYNLGFIAIQRSPEGNQLLEWWQSHLQNDCVVDLPHGLFVDQKWANLIPALFENVDICRDPGWNTAYWNLAQRQVRKDEQGHFWVNNAPLFFFHFSGVNVEGTRFSSHQDRFTIASLPEAVQTLVADYCSRLRENGAEAYRKIEYAYNCFPSGKKIPDFIRRLCHSHPTIANELGSLNSDDGEEKWIAYALEIPPGYSLLNRAALSLYETRIDLSNAFPDVPAGNETPYANWFVDNGEQQPDMDAVFVKDVQTRLRGGSSASPLRQTPSSKHGLKIKLYRSIYQIAWKLQRWVTPLTSMAFRRKIHNFLVHLAYNPRDSSAKIPHVTPPPHGVNIIGYLHAESGVGRAARLSIRAAHAVELPLSLRNFELGCTSRQLEHPEEASHPHQEHGINLFHINADQMPIVHSQLEPELFAGHYNIGYWYWELPEFPDEWCEAYSHLDEIWVATSFCQEAISKKSPIPVIKMPPGIDIHPQAKFDREYFTLPAQSFLFLVLADGLSFFERKNVMATLEAFERAFPHPQSDVSLVIKLMNGTSSKNGYTPLLERAQKNPAVQIVDQTFSREEIDSLISVCDSVVSLHRAEGFGLPMAEAMFLGKPVMATHWSGNTEFMDHETAFPIKCKIIEIQENYGPYQKGMHWAEPDVEDAARLFKLISDNGPEIQAIAACGQKHIRTEFSLEAAGKRMDARLKWILKRSWGAS
ncbi:glycosyltransferase [Kiritimatiellota bacterium B12222]|nr:glycosyltransferase [Kiritimatiellota bacterium B12222]